MQMQKIGLIVADSVETAEQVRIEEFNYPDAQVYTQADLSRLLDSRDVVGSFWTWWKNLNHPAIVIVVPDADTLRRFNAMRHNARTILTRAIWGPKLPHNLIQCASDIIIAGETERQRIDWRAVK